ncbi:hypothetical protein C8J56DRAFT_885214 [Mycena floridula]|nr:hypothetical protein C8J56DRAFT_885213 [Mycena floridula]KAJ7594691.1 hypothetical protein C8J56DRAFT_885214 [Mycena floridula]
MLSADDSNCGEWDLKGFNHPVIKAFVTIDRADTSMTVMDLKFAIRPGSSGCSGDVKGELDIVKGDDARGESGVVVAPAWVAILGKCWCEDIPGSVNCSILEAEAEGSEMRSAKLGVQTKWKLVVVSMDVISPRQLESGVVVMNEHLSSRDSARNLAHQQDVGGMKNVGGRGDHCGFLGPQLSRGRREEDSKNENIPTKTMSET